MRKGQILRMSSILEWATASKRVSAVSYRKWAGCGLVRILFVLAFLLGGVEASTTVYQKPSEFIAANFGGKLPTTRALKLSGTHQAMMKRFLGHSYKPSTVRYWAQGGTFVVILEEIGKTQPITTGFVVKGGRIDQVKVLIYRESHGFEVSRSSFTKQFRKAGLKSDGKLDRRVDGITGATLSVRALTGLARVALYLDRVAPK
jgi:hypothetical protein